LPEPRKPVMMVAGMRLSGGMTVEASDSSDWGGAAVVAATVKRRAGLRGNGAEREWVSDRERVLVLRRRGRRVVWSERVNGLGLR